MQTTLIFAFLLLIHAVSWRSANAAASVAFYTDPAHPGKCVPKPDMILNVDEVIKDPNTECGIVKCAAKGETTFLSCGVAAPPKGCKFTGILRPDELYPSCCEPRLECPNQAIDKQSN